MSRLRTLPRVHSHRSRNLPLARVLPCLRRVYDPRAKRNINGLKACTTQNEATQIEARLHAPPVVQGFSPSMSRLRTLPRVHSDGGRNLPCRCSAPRVDRPYGASW